MIREIFPLKELPPRFEYGGDYYATQSALMVAAMAERDVSIFDYNRSIETDQTISVLKTIGLGVLKNENRLQIETGYGMQIPEDKTIEFEPGAYPLSLAIGLLAGKNVSCSLEYAPSVNPDIVDQIIDVLSRNGIDIHHAADDSMIIFRSAGKFPVNINVKSSIPHIKNCLIVFSLASGVPVTVREYTITSDHLEQCLRSFEIPIQANEPAIVVVDDPNDPRKKIRKREAEYLREINIPADFHIENYKYYVPGDAACALAYLTLAAVTKKEITLEGMPINAVNSKYIQHLKAVSGEVSIFNRRDDVAGPVADVGFKPSEIKSRKMTGQQTAVMIDEIPLVAVLAALAAGTTVIRGIADYSDCGINPFYEIAGNLERVGIKAGILEDGLAIEGGKEISGADFEPFINSRIGLAFLVAAFAGQGPSTFDGFEIIENHFPIFVDSILKN
jgi:3-phosphoshikimate 1-carboxyvinyltransferase